jgi:hypothetical protein
MNHPAALIIALAGTLSLSACDAAQQGEGMVPGLYECWAWGQARMMLNVTVTGPGRYRGEDSGRTGKYTLVGRDLTWTSGPLKGILPEDFRAIYEVRNGTPTISYGRPDEMEASFCENVP